MKVCMLVWSYWPVPTGGAETQCRKLCHQLSLNNIECTVITACLDKESVLLENDGKVKIVRIPVPQLVIDRLLFWRDKLRRKKIKCQDEGGASYLPSQRESKETTLLSDVVRWTNSFSFMVGASLWFSWHRRKIDVIHVHVADWFAGYAGWIGNKLGIPVLCKAADMPVFPKMDGSIPFYRLWDKWRRKVQYVAMHHAIEQELLYEEIPVDHIRQIPNGVEIPWEMSKPRVGSYVLFVGNFTQGHEHKGFDVLLDAWVDVCQSFSEALLVLAGKGEVDFWQNEVEQRDCSENVKFIGYVENTDELYKNAALFVLPSRHEGMSNALLEAQARGLPAVVSDIPGNKAIVEHGVSGLVVPPGSAKSLAEAIRCLLNDPALRAEMGRNARIRMEKHFSIEAVSTSYLNLYGQLIFNK